MEWTYYYYKDKNKDDGCQWPNICGRTSKEKKPKHVVTTWGKLCEFIRQQFNAKWRYKKTNLQWKQHVENHLIYMKQHAKLMQAYSDFWNLL